MSKLGDSSCIRNLNQRNTTFMKKLLGDNIISMDKNALKFAISAQDGDFSCQMVPFQLYTNFNHL